MTKKVSKSIFVTIAVAVVAVGFYFAFLRQPDADKSVAVVPDSLFGWKFPENTFPLATKFAGTTGPQKNLFDFEIAFSNIRDPGGIPQGLPVRLKIPIIGVDSTIEDALITPDGRMDVPSGSVDVAWFALGPHPGQEGSAVIGGHFGIRNGVPFVFYNLDKLKIGDKIYIEDDKGDTLAFQVRKIQLFERDADATTVFTSQDGKAHLNVITCEGVWNQVNGTYPQRRVVFTDAIASEGPITVNPLLPVTAIQPIAPSISPTPPNTPNPSPAPITMPTPSPTPTPIPTPTTTTTNNPTTPTSTSETSNTPTQTIKSLFTTPLDGIITLLLLLGIFFVAIKIIMVEKVTSSHA